MKKYVKAALVILGTVVLALNYGSTERGKTYQTKRVRNMDMPKIPNNGGL